MYLRKIGLRALIAAALVLPLVADAYEVWSGEYRAYNEDWFRAATFISGGDWIVVGSNNETTSKLTENLRMIRIDETGEVVWDARILGDSPTADRRDVFRGVAPSPDGGWVTAGDLKMFNGLGDSDAWVAKWDSEGAMVWSKLIGTGFREYGFQIVASPGGGYFLYGSTSVGTSSLVTVVVKLAENGDILWETHFEDPVVPLDTSSIAATADGGCAFVAWRPPYNLVVKLHPDGEVDWMREIGGGTWPSAVLRSIIPLPGAFALIGEIRHRPSSETYYRPWLVMLSPDGAFFSEYRLKMWESWISPTGEVMISEIRTALPDSNEYFELSGTPGTSLDGLTYLVIGDDVECDPLLEPDGCRTNSGIIEEVIELTGQIPSSGFFVVAQDGFDLNPVDLTTDLNFEDSDNVTHLLVRGFSGALEDDLDTYAPDPPWEDGVFDETPWTEIVDQVALIEEVIEEGHQPFFTEFYYASPALGPDYGFPKTPPAHVYRGPSGWAIGERELLAGQDTPGLPNPVGSIENSHGWDVIEVDDGTIWTGFAGTTNWFVKTDRTNPEVVHWKHKFLEPGRDSIATDLVVGPGGTFVGVGTTASWDSWMVRARASTGEAATTCSMGTFEVIIDDGYYFSSITSDVVVSRTKLLEELPNPAVAIEDMYPPILVYCSEINEEVYVMGSSFEDGGFGDWSKVVQ